MALKAAVETIHGLQYKIRMMGIPNNEENTHHGREHVHGLQHYEI